MINTVCSINITGFKAAVAEIKDKTLKGRPFVIAGSCGGRSLVMDCSQEAIRQGLFPGTALAIAERRIKDLIVLPPDIPAYTAMNKEIEKVVARYAPVWENDGMGNLYLDITGTTGLFGPPVDCSSRVLRDIKENTCISPACAVASNKLVSKVATRTIRSSGLIQVHEGTEAEFLSHQDVRLLPGMGRKLLRTAEVTGIREIGEIASLTDPEALALFGKNGIVLRDMALGIDNSPVKNAGAFSGAKRSITQNIDFNEDEIDEDKIKCAIQVLVEHGGLQMRNEKLGTRTIRLGVKYSDGMETQGAEKFKHTLVTDAEIMTEVFKLYKKITARRIRLRSIYLNFEELVPLCYQPDLFEPETATKSRKLQEAVDKIQNRFGVGKVTRGFVLVASS